MLGGVKGQPLGGLQMYFSSVGSVDWTKAWEMSPDFDICLRLTAIVRRRRNCKEERTGAKQSAVDQSCGSKLPRTTMRYFARTGSPCSSVLMVDIAMVGRALPNIGRRD